MFIQLKQKEEILYGKRYETIYAEEFIKKLFNTITLPEILKSEEELRNLNT